MGAKEPTLDRNLPLIRAASLSYWAASRYIFLDLPRLGTPLDR